MEHEDGRILTRTPSGLTMDTGNLDLGDVDPFGSIPDAQAESMVAKVYVSVAHLAAGKDVAAIKAVINTVHSKGNLVAAKLLEVVLPDQDTTAIPLNKVIDVFAGILILCADMSLGKWLAEHIYDDATQGIVERYCNAKAATRVATVVAKATKQQAETPSSVFTQIIAKPERNVSNTYDALVQHHKSIVSTQTSLSDIIKALPTFTGGFKRSREESKANAEKILHKVSDDLTLPLNLLLSVFQDCSFGSPTVQKEFELALVLLYRERLKIDDRRKSLRNRSVEWNSLAEPLENLFSNDDVKLTKKVVSDSKTLSKRKGYGGYNSNNTSTTTTTGGPSAPQATAPPQNRRGGGGRGGGGRGRGKRSSSTSSRKSK